MVEFEVAEPILNIPYEVPRYHWKIEENRPPEKMDGRRPAGYFYREPGIDPDDVKGYWQEIELANKIREKLDEYICQGLNEQSQKEGNDQQPQIK